MENASHLYSWYNTCNGVVYINVPGGISLDVWTEGNESARLMQYTVDDDLELEVTFESAVIGNDQILNFLKRISRNNA